MQSIILIYLPIIVLHPRPYHIRFPIILAFLLHMNSYRTPLLLSHTNTIVIHILLFYLDMDHTVHSSQTYAFYLIMQSWHDQGHFYISKSIMHFIQLNKCQFNPCSQSAEILYFGLVCQKKCFDFRIRAYIFCKW